MTESTVAKIGRSMKNFEITFCLSSLEEVDRRSRRVRQAYSRRRTTALHARGASARVRLTHPTTEAAPYFLLARFFLRVHRHRRLAGDGHEKPSGGPSCRRTCCKPPTRTQSSCFKPVRMTRRPSSCKAPTVTSRSGTLLSASRTNTFLRPCSEVIALSVTSSASFSRRSASARARTCRGP